MTTNSSQLGRKDLIGLISGGIFGIGLMISGMVQPSKIRGFLDVFGDWDPSLVFVMVGAILVHGISFFFVKRNAVKKACDDWLPKGGSITPALVIGSAIFGVGWGIGGYCPGPSITSIGDANPGAAFFVAGMIAGIFAFNKLNTRYSFKR